MSKKLDFYILDSWFSARHKNLFVINGFTDNSGESHNSITEFPEIKIVCDYIVERYKDRSSSVKSRNLKISVDEEKFLSLIQTTTYESYTSYKIYKVYSTVENIEKLRTFIYNTDFKDYKKKSS